jgi:hypothetical protein
MEFLGRYFLKTLFFSHNSQRKSISFSHKRINAKTMIIVFQQLKQMKNCFSIEHLKVEAFMNVVGKNVNQLGCCPHPYQKKNVNQVW